MAEGRRPGMMAKPVAMDCEFVSCPITALAFFKVGPGIGYRNEDGSGGGHGQKGDARRRTCLLAGEDTQLKIYDVETESLCGKLQVFAASVIHGIFVGSGVSDGSILVWGGCSVAVLSRSVLEELLGKGGGWDDAAPVVTEATAPDWIYDGTLDPVLPAGRGAVDGILVTAHNEVVELRIVNKREPMCHPTVEFGYVASPSRPILYSANVRWLSGDVVLVAGGTVFGEIIVWRWHPTKGDCKVLFMLEGHEGSIFGVHISDELTTPSGDVLRLLASCSDDRTVRIWDITENNWGEEPSSLKSQTGKLVEEGRETGFGGKKQAGDGPQADSMDHLACAPMACSRRALAVAMGHMSRIWHVKFSTQGLPLRPRQEDTLKIMVYSFGEDATTQEWLFDLTEASSGTLTHINTTPCHSGKHIWSTALLASSKPRRRPLVATGGADGKIALLGDAGTRETTSNGSVSSCPDIHTGNSWLDVDSDHIAVSYSFADIGLPPDAAVPAQVPASGGKGNRGAETFKTFAFASQDELLVTSTLGNLFLGKILDDGEVSWAKITINDAERSDLRNYNIVRGGGDSYHNISFIGSATGVIYMFTTSLPTPRLLKIADLGRKISDIFPLPRGARSPANLESQSQSDSKVEVVVTLLGQDEAYLLSIGDTNSTEDSIASTQRISIPLGNGRVITAAVTCNDTLVLGTRDGHLIFFRHNGLHGGLEDESKVLGELLETSTTSKDAITSIVPLPGVRGGAQCPYILTTCRDGKYMIYEITENSNFDAGAPGKDEELRNIELIHESCPPFGPIIADAWFQRAADSSGDLELILCGFRSRYFMVWNETRQHEIATVDCGGAHRTFAYTRAASHGPDDWVRFAYIKAQRTHIHTQRRAGHSALRNGIHGREVRATTWCGDLLATAAEDTTVRIWKYPQTVSDRATMKRRKEMRCMACLNVHTAGLQSLQWCGPGYLISSAGNEELFVWRVSRLDDRSAYTGGLAVVREAVYPDRTQDRDLRIVDVAVDAAGDAAGGSFFISIVLSNSVLRSYLYSKAKGFEILAQSRYTGACLTQIRHLEVGSSRRLCLLTASTDGTVIVWECADPRVPGAEKETVAGEYGIRGIYTLHQSSIKGLDVSSLCPQEEGEEKAASWVVLTAGDDNAMGVLHLRQGPGSEDAAKGKELLDLRCHRAIVRSAHAAGITGLRIVGSRNEERMIFAATVSNDQRVKIWIVGLGDDISADKEDAAAIRVQLLQNKYSAVADAGDLDFVEREQPGTGGRLVVTGVGVEVWDLSLS